MFAILYFSLLTLSVVNGDSCKGLKCRACLDVPDYGCNFVKSPSKPNGECYPQEKEPLDATFFAFSKNDCPKPWPKQAAEVRVGEERDSCKGLKCRECLDVPDYGCNFVKSPSKPNGECYPQEKEPLDATFFAFTKNDCPKPWPKQAAEASVGKDKFDRDMDKLGKDIEKPFKKKRTAAEASVGKDGFDRDMDKLGKDIEKPFKRKKRTEAAVGWSLSFGDCVPGGRDSGMCDRRSSHDNMSDSCKKCKRGSVWKGYKQPFGNHWCCSAEDFAYAWASCTCFSDPPENVFDGGDSNTDDEYKELGPGAVLVGIVDGINTRKNYLLQMENPGSGFSVYTTTKLSEFKQIADLKSGQSATVSLAVRNMDPSSSGYGQFINNGAVTFKNSGGSLVVSNGDHIPKNVHIDNLGDGRFEVVLESETPAFGRSRQAPRGGISSRVAAVPAQSSGVAFADESPKVHTLDQEYHMKETTSEDVFDKEESWTRNERKGKAMVGGKKMVRGSYDDKCGCRFAYCESQVLDTEQCCEYYRENSECDGVSKHKCEATCAGLKFEGGNRKGEDVCTKTICEDPLNWVNVETGGCTREPSKKDKCCDQKTCEFAERAVGSYIARHRRDERAVGAYYGQRPRDEEEVGNSSENYGQYRGEFFVTGGLDSSDYVVYGFAALGFGFVVYGAGRHYTKQTGSTYTTIESV